MPLLRVRVKGPNGKSETLSVDSDEDVTAFFSRMGQVFGCPGKSFELLNGFPPKKVDTGSCTRVGDALKSGDSVTLRLAQNNASSSRESRKRSAPSTRSLSLGDMLFYSRQGGAVDTIKVVALHPGPPATPESYTVLVEDSTDAERVGREINVPSGSNKLSFSPPDHPAKKASSSEPTTGWTCSACTFINKNDSASACEICGTSRPPAQAAAAASSRLPSRSTSIVAKQRKIPDDNSCLFHAVSFLLQRRETPGELRRLIATNVQDHPAQWSSAILGKSREDYVNFILDSKKWGGQVELNILSSVMKTELACVDIQTGRCDAYGQGSGYQKRVYMLFSGIHFDAVEFVDNSGQAVTMVDPGNAKAMTEAKRLASTLRSQGLFVDQNTMKLVCNTCGFEMNGDFEARSHAGSSGHTNFSMKK
jgi:ubiquitin thioesterase OTU1